MWKSDTYFEPASSVTVAEGVLLKGMMGDMNSEALKSLLIILDAFLVRSAKESATTFSFYIQDQPQVIYIPRIHQTQERARARPPLSSADHQAQTRP